MNTLWSEFIIEKYYFFYHFSKNIKYLINISLCFQKCQFAPSSFQRFEDLSTFQKHQFQPNIFSRSYSFIYIYILACKKEEKEIERINFGHFCKFE